MHRLEQIANHFGAPIPHPSNILNYASAGPLQPRPEAQQSATKIDSAFLSVVNCLSGASSPAVYIVNNLHDSGPDAVPEITGGQHWHTDIEFEPIPLSTSVFYAHVLPTPRNVDGKWVSNPHREPGFYHPDSAPRLAQLRESLPLNGETAYADTAAAFAALPVEQQQELENVMVRRRFRRDDEG